MKEYVDRFHTCFRSMRQSMRRDLQTLLGDELTPSQFLVMRRLRHRGRSTTSELAGLLGVTAGAVTALTNHLEDHDLLRKDRSPEDRRVLYLELTSRGERYCRQLENRWYSLLERSFSSLSAGERETLLTLLDKVAATMCSESGVPAEAEREGG